MLTSNKGIRVIWVDILLEEKTKDVQVHFIHYDTCKGISEHSVLESKSIDSLHKQ